MLVLKRLGKPAIAGSARRDRDWQPERSIAGRASPQYCRTGTLMTHRWRKQDSNFESRLRKAVVPSRVTWIPGHWASPSRQSGEGPEVRIHVISRRDRQDRSLLGSHKNQRRVVTGREYCRQTVVELRLWTLPSCLLPVKRTPAPTGAVIRRGRGHAQSAGRPLRPEIPSWRRAKFFT